MCSGQGVLNNFIVAERTLKGNMDASRHKLGVEDLIVLIIMNPVTNLIVMPTHVLNDPENVWIFPEHVLERNVIQELN